MHWQVLVFVIVAAVLILSHLFGKVEQPPRRRPPGPGGPAEGARPQSEIERFLEEVSRMKRRATEEATGQSSEEPRLAPSPPPRPAPPPVPPRVERLPRPVPATVRRAEPPTRERPALAVTVLSPVPAPPPLVEAVLVPVQPPLALSVPTSPLAPRVSPAAAQLHSLLRSPQTLRTAVLLQEVLGPPRCRRR
jgi:hypothetical protein